MLDNEKLEKLINYYKDSGLLIVGLNDSQGVNTTSTFFKKGLLEYLASSLKSDELTPEVINAFSLTMNKTEHIDYFLKNNLSVEDIKLSQIYSFVSALEKVMTDIGLPKFLGEFGNVYRLIYRPKKGDNKINLSTSLKEAKEPVMIYSSGVNNYMRELGVNPFGVQKDYKLRDKRPNYYYALEKANNPNTLKGIIDSIERNYNTILGINLDTDIYTLGTYIPKSLQNEGMKIFRDLAVAYNEELLSLCKQYGITFVNTEEVGKKYNNSESNFHISTAGHYALANCILGLMYRNKFEENDSIDRNINPIEINNKGSLGVKNDLLLDYLRSRRKLDDLSGYEYDRGMEIADEHLREVGVFQKILTRKNKNIK